MRDWQPGFPPLAPGEILAAGYGEIFCHPDIARDLMEDGLTVDGRPARAILIDKLPLGWQLRINVESDQDWWCYGEHCVRTGVRNRELQRQQLLESAAT